MRKNWFFQIFYPPWIPAELLIKVLFLHNRCVNFRVPSKIFWWKNQFWPLFGDTLLLQSFQKVKFPKLTTLAVKIILAIKICQGQIKIWKLWLKIAYLTLLLSNFFNFINKKVVSNTHFLCSGAPLDQKST